MKTETAGRADTHPRTALERGCTEPQRVAAPANRRSRQMLRWHEGMGFLPERNIVATRCG